MKHFYTRKIAIAFLLIFIACASCSKDDDMNSENQTSSTTSSVSLQNQYNTQKGYLISNIKSYNNATNSALRLSLLKGIRTIQKLMRTIRENAAKKGCYITKSSLEDW